MPQAGLDFAAHFRVKERDKMAFGAEMDRQDGSLFNVEAVAFLLKARADQVVQRRFIVFLPCQNHVGLAKRAFHLFHRCCTSFMLFVYRWLAGIVRVQDSGSCGACQPAAILESQRAQS